MPLQEGLLQCFFFSEGQRSWQVHVVTICKCPPNAMLQASHECTGCLHLVLQQQEAAKAPHSVYWADSLPHASTQVWTLPISCTCCRSSGASQPGECCNVCCRDMLAQPDADCHVWVPLLCCAADICEAL